MTSVKKKDRDIDTNTGLVKNSSLNAFVASQRRLSHPNHFYGTMESKCDHTGNRNEEPDSKFRFTKTSIEDNKDELLNSIIQSR